MKNLKFALTLALSVAFVTVPLTAASVKAQDPQTKNQATPASMTSPTMRPAIFATRPNTSAATVLTIQIMARWKNIAKAISRDLKWAMPPALIGSRLIRASRLT